MKSQIKKELFQTASALPTIEAVAAIHQLLIEACDKFPDVEPAGFSYHETPLADGKAINYFFHSKTKETESEIIKGFAGMGSTPEAAYSDLMCNMCKWFKIVNCSKIINENSEDVTELVLNGVELRTEYAL
jgi:hypothetical protein